MHHLFSLTLRLPNATINHYIRRMRTRDEHYSACSISGLYPPAPVPLCAAFDAS